ncbi:MAG: hypothetical protein V2A73_07455 [Pseudomonadota bacterium]
MNSITEQDLRELVAGLLQRAKAGDVAAAKLLLAYSVGEPVAGVNPDDLPALEHAGRQAGRLRALESATFGDE